MDDRYSGNNDPEVALLDIVETETVNGKAKLKRTIMELPAVIPEDGKAFLPKEAWLVEFVRAERRLGRKTLIYLRQTGTRDIQYRLERILKDAGIRALVLTSSVEARKREAWIAGKVYGIDALIVNPRLVETGLDLVAFSNVVFVEIEYSALHVVAGPSAGLASRPDPKSQGGVCHLQQHHGSPRAGLDGPEDESRTDALWRRSGRGYRPGGRRRPASQAGARSLEQGRHPRSAIPVRRELPC